MMEMQESRPANCLQPERAGAKSGSLICFYGLNSEELLPLASRLADRALLTHYYCDLSSALPCKDRKSVV
jgi:hypothetical protein